MAEVYDKDNIRDFTAWLAASAVNDAYYKTHPQGGFLYKRDMNVMQYLFFVAGGNREVITQRLENLRKSPMDVHSRVFFTFVFVVDLAAEDRNAFNEFLNEQLDDNTKAQIITEFIVYDFSCFEYYRVGGGKILDALLRKVLKSASISKDHAGEPKKRNSIEDIRIQEKGKKLYYHLAVIVIINLIIFIIDAILEDKYGTKPLFEFGMQYNQAVSGGEWWRLITSVFLHADAEHIMGNMLTLVVISRALQGFYTGFEYWIIYMFSGLIGSIFTVLCMPANVVSVGASGAIMGLGGVLIYRMFFGKSAVAFRHAGSFFSIGLIIVYNLLAGLFSETINNFAHFSGFFAGFLMAWLIDLIRAKRKKKNNKISPA